MTATSKAHSELIHSPKTKAESEAVGPPQTKADSERRPHPGPSSTRDNLT